MEKVFIISVLLFVLLVFNILHDVFYVRKGIDYDNSLLTYLLFGISMLIIGVSIFTFNQGHDIVNVLSLLSVLLTFLYKKFFDIYIENLKIIKVLRISYYVISVCAILFGFYMSY